MSAPTPYFYTKSGTPSWNPSPGDTEVPSLQKINGQLATIVAKGSSGGGSGPVNSFQLIDTVTSQVWTVTAQNGILTLS
jgi:hypothetical protein